MASSPLRINIVLGAHDALAIFTEVGDPFRCDVLKYYLAYHCHCCRFRRRYVICMYLKHTVLRALC